MPPPPTPRMPAREFAKVSVVPEPVTVVLPLVTEMVPVV